METAIVAPGRVELARGLSLRDHGPAPDAHASLDLARTALDADPGPALVATLAATDAAWSAGDHTACLAVLSDAVDRRSGADAAEGDYLAGMLALLRGRPDAPRMLRRTVERTGADRDPGRLLLAVAAALLAGDVQVACHVGARALAAARASGQDAQVAQATEYVAYAELRAGRHAQAREHALAGWRAAQRTGRVNTAAHHRAVLALVASVQGPWSAVDDHAAAALSTARRHGLAQPVTLAEWALARSELAQGRSGDAAVRMRSLLAPRGGAHFALRGLVLPTLIEAAVLSDDDSTARGALPELTAWSRSAGDPQGRALLERCRALLADDATQGDAHFRRAHRCHGDAGGAFETARTLLLHGKWLRRHRRTGDARERLRAALQLFERCGAEPWADSARAELRAAGVATDAMPSDIVGALTAHQLRIAHRVAAGETNREIAERLSVSVRTVDCHLRNIFVALGVRSRVELARCVPPSGSVAP